MIIIASAGLAQCGKTTFCDHIENTVDKDKYDVVRMAMAQRLKAGLSKMGVTKKDTPDLYRELAQHVGTEKLRAHDEDWWVKLVNEDLKYFVETDISDGREVVILIDDIRFMNEVELIHRWGGQIVFIDAMARQDDLDAEWRKHPSEDLARLYSAGDDSVPDETFDYVMTNYFSVQGFKDEITRLLPELLTH